MSRLTTLDGLPKPHAKTVGPHRFRAVGGRVLVTGEAGRYVWLTAAEYERYLSGTGQSEALWSRLSADGLIKSAFDFDAAAEDLAERGAAAWRGPGRHVVFVDGMALGTARQVVDFCFAAPGDGVALSLRSAEPDAAFGTLWFCVQYARRKSEWSRRPLSLSLATPASPSARVAELARGHGLAVDLLLAVNGAPRKLFAASRADAAVSPGARDPAGWVKALARAGVRRAALTPSREAWSPRGRAAFLRFYAVAVDAMLGEEDLREEWAAAFLSRRRWALPGFDVLGELAYGPDGGIHTSAAALSLDEDSRRLLRVGDAATTRFSELAQSGAVRAALAASLPDNQPQCFHCVYSDRCAAVPSASLAAQGTLWGQTPSSPLCELQMGMLDALFVRLRREESRRVLERWVE